MTKKDYEVLAQALNEQIAYYQNLVNNHSKKGTYDGYDIAKLAAVKDTVIVVAGHLYTHTHNFDSDKFLEACGM